MHDPRVNTARSFALYLALLMSMSYKYKVLEIQKSGERLADLPSLFVLLTSKPLLEKASRFWRITTSDYPKS